MRPLPFLAQQAAVFGDAELALPQPLEAETFNEVVYVMHVLARAQDALQASRRSLEARHVPMDMSLIDRACTALDRVYAVAAPIILASAEAASRRAA